MHRSLEASYEYEAWMSELIRRQQVPANWAALEYSLRGVGDDKAWL